MSITDSASARQTWLEARSRLLDREKALTRQKDEISRQLRALPPVPVDQDYRFVSAAGEVGLADLFAGKSQLIVYHFMFGPDWQEGCKSCSLLADHFDGMLQHLPQRDAAFVAVSNAPLERLDAFRRRMGWGFTWVSSKGDGFSRDFGVTFTPEEQEYTYNFRTRTGTPMAELPGLSVFIRDDDGQVHHTYSSYARGLDRFIGVYQFLDVLPKGRDEDNLSYGMEWVRLHDRYDG